MKGCLTVFLFLFVFINSQAQINVDSLELVIEKRPGTSRVVFLNETATKLFNQDPLLSEKYANRALSLAKRLDYKEGQVEALTVLGALCNIRFQLSEGRELLSQALALAEEISYDKGISSANYSLGSNYMKSGFYELAIECFIKGLEDAKKKKDFSREMQNLLDLGIAKTVIGEFDTAEKYFKEGIDRIKSKNSSSKPIHFMGSLGNLEMARGNYGLAENYWLEALNYIKQSKAERLLINCWIQLGTIYSKLSSEKLAIQYLDSAQVLSSELGLVSERLNIMRSKARVYLDYGNIDNGIKVLDSAIALKSGYREDPRFKMGLYSLKADFNERIGNYQEAFNAYKIFTNIKDSLLFTQNYEKIAEVNAKYEFDQLKSEAEAEAQLNEINQLRINQRNLVILVLCILFMVSILIFLWNKKRLENRLLLTQKEQEILERESALKNHEIKDQGKRILDYKEKLEQAEQQAVKEGQEDKLVDFLRTSSMHAVDWVAFRIAFDEKFPSFFNALEEHVLTVNEERLCSLIKLGLVTREIAELLAISPNSVIKAKSRLNKKMKLTNKQHLDTYLKEVDLAIK
ncbi:tetratricopeptide repeat protein [Roseivirga misakiensis]|uniref:HTH luxR-type domain-containing protein n=1 Tax=Roseivirga misakiensis TaxID=1563681 RepID=A0A1E5T7W8_9BACT|nr:transcriptional regulator [Roseivirga misakiensis]OEK07438.1 hypothetical protein BFP71_00065 [Roseivirga misakiensis]